MPTDLFDDAEQARLAEEQAAQMRRDELHDLAVLMEDATVRRLLRRILDRAGPLRQTFNPSDARADAFASGERNVGLWLLGELIEASPQRAAALLIEAKSAQA